MIFLWPFPQVSVSGYLTLSKQWDRMSFLLWQDMCRLVLCWLFENGASDDRVTLQEVRCCSPFMSQLETLSRNLERTSDTRKAQLNVKELSYVENSWAKCLCLSQGMCCRTAEQSLPSGACQAPSEISQRLKAEYKTKLLQLKNLIAWFQRVFTPTRSPMTSFVYPHSHTL